MAFSILTLAARELLRSVTSKCTVTARNGRMHLRPSMPAPIPHLDPKSSVYHNCTDAMLKRAVHSGGKCRVVGSKLVVVRTLKCDGPNPNIGRRPLGASTPLLLRIRLFTTSTDNGSNESPETSEAVTDPLNEPNAVNDANVKDSGSEDAAADASEGVDGFLRLVEEQKLRALDLWEKCCDSSKLSVPPDLEERVRSELHQAKVPPIFHAVVRSINSNPLFPASTHPLSLSSERVVNGMEEPLGTKGIVPDMEDRTNSLFHLFFSADGEFAKRKVRDEGFHWHFAQRESRNVTALLNSSASMVGEDIEVTGGLPFVPFKVESNPPYSLVTRNVSRGVVASCFDSSKPESEVAITGSPGIGKSWTLLYALQQALLYENACVAFISQRTRDSFIYIRKASRIFAWVARVPYPAITYFMDRHNTLLLLDPREANRGGASYDSGKGMLIFAASNNYEHFKNDIFKTERFPERYLNPWTVKELKVALPYMREDVAFEVAMKRARVVGMLPRYLFSEQFYNFRRSRLDIALKELGADEVESLLIWDGKDNGDKTVTGTILAVYATPRPRDDGSVDPGYDGEHVLYAERRLEIMSEAVTKRLSVLERAELLSLWGKASATKGSAMGCAIEDLFWNDDLHRFTKEIGFSMERWQQIKDTPNPPILSRMENKELWTTTPKRLNISDLDVVFNREDVICRCNVNSAAIDFAGPGRKVYKVAVDKNKAFNVQGMIDVLVQGEYLKKDGNGNYERNVHTPEKLEFMWIIPQGLKREWIKANPTIVHRIDPLRNLLQDCLDAHVNQYVIPMDPDRASFNDNSR